MLGKPHTPLFTETGVPPGARVTPLHAEESNVEVPYLELPDSVTVHGTYARKASVVYPKFICDRVLCVLSGHPNLIDWL